MTSQASTLKEEIISLEDYFSATSLVDFYKESRVPWEVRRRRMAIPKADSAITKGYRDTEVKVLTLNQIETPFEQIDVRRNEDEKVSEIISYLRKHLNVDFAQRVAARLEFLVDVAKEENPSESAISPESLSNFIAFIQSNPGLAYPDIVLSPSKNIRAQWRVAPNRHFAVEFLTTGDAHFVVFSPDPNHPERTMRLSGIVSVDSLMRIVEPNGVLHWAIK